MKWYPFYLSYFCVVNTFRIRISIILMSVSILIFGGIMGYLIYSSYQLEASKFSAIAAPTISAVYFGLTMNSNYLETISSDISGFLNNPEEKEMERIGRELRTVFSSFSRIDSLAEHALREKGIDIKPDFAFSVARIELRNHPSVDSIAHNQVKTISEVFLFGNRERLNDRTYLGFYKWTGDFYLENRLYISYPGLWKYLLLKQKWLIAGIITAGLFMMCIFLYTIQTMLKQKKLSDMKNDFINNITHELNTPISTIRIAGQNLQKRQINTNPSSVLDLSATILRQNKRLQDIVERVIRQTIGPGQDVMNMQPLFLNQLLHRIIADIKLSVEKPLNIDEQLHASDDRFYGDELSMTGAIYNVLDNACKYSGKHIQIVVSTANEGSHLVLKISDNGRGIPANYHKKIFDQFFRISEGNCHNVQGLGLGLYYLKLVMDLHHVQINLDSKINQGTLFSFYFPVIHETKNTDC